MRRLSGFEDRVLAVNLDVAFFPLEVSDVLFFGGSFFEGERDLDRVAYYNTEPES